VRCLRLRLLGAVCMLLVALAPAALRGETMRVRVEWGGGPAQVWEGSIAVSRGTVAEPSPLGIEADEPAAMFVRDGQLSIRQPSPRSYDGVDLLVDAALEDQLLVQLAPRGQPAPPPVKVNLADLVGDLHTSNLDGQGNRLLVRRSPGDKLQVSLAQRSLVFTPGETLKLDVRPHLLPVAASARLKLAAQLVDVRGSAALWSAEHAVKAAQPADIPLSVPLPNQEGIYELVLTVSQVGWQHAVRAPLGSKPVAERRVQVAVLAARGPTPSPTVPELTRIVEIDPASPHWWERLPKLPQLPWLARLRRGPLGNGNYQMRQHALGLLAQLNPNRPAADASWEAYWLPIAHAGAPHVLEIDYPSDVPQTVSVSILEPNSSGALAAINVDSGFELPPNIPAQAEAPRWMRHRVVFWPRTKLPLVLVANRSETTPAVYGKIRVLAGWEQLPRALPGVPVLGSRMMTAYLDRPLFTKCFSASDALDAWSGRSLDDWVTFYEGATRLVEYLNYVGYDSLMLSVLADGSTLYPSALVQPTPRYDTGAFFDTAQDPVRKDVLRMLLRLFDREQLRLIPALEFSSPLPQLEEIRRRGGAEADGLEWIGPEGTTWTQALPSRRPLGAYYNVLDPRVQDAMLAVIREVVQTYSQHPSFAGLALQLTSDGYAQLPGPEWGLDDVTLARFQRDANVKLPTLHGPERFAQRARLVAQEPVRRIWLQWRADQLHAFYQRILLELAAVRGDARLYLAGANLFRGPEIDYELRPTLPRRAAVAETLLELGIDVRHYQSDAGIVLMRPEVVAPLTELNAQAVQLELQQMPDADRAYSDLATPGGLFFHQPQRLRLPSFDEKSPFHPTSTDLVSHVIPAGRQSRRRFVHALAQLDPQILADGGWLLPLGQEEALRDLLAIYRKLPPIKLERLVDEAGSDAAQPVTIRTASHAGRTFACLVNDAAFGVALRVRVEGPDHVTLEDLAGTRQLSPLQHDDEGTYWKVELEPFDVVAFTFSQPGVRLARPTVSVAPEVEQELAGRVRALSARTVLLANPPPLNVLRNPSFELPPTADAPLPGWLVPPQTGVNVQLDAAQRRAGSQSLRISSGGPAGRVVSDVFEAPRSGRLSMSVWLRLNDPQQQPALRLAVEGKLDGEDYYRFAPLGKPLDAHQPGVPLTDRWAQYIFQVNDLPLEGLSQVRLRFDLMGPGEVWVDDVQVFDLSFNRKERIELSKLVALADVKLQNGKLGDCVRILDGYWPRFLEAAVALAPGVVSQDLPPAPTGESAHGENADKVDKDAPAERTGLLDRMKGAIPKRLRLN